MGRYKIDSASIKNPTKHNVGRFKVSDLERLANSDMTGRMIGKKIKHTLTYDAISAYELDKILDELWEKNKMFYNFTYPIAGPLGTETKTIVVYPGEIPSELHRAGKTTNWVWKNVHFNLIQK